MIDQIHLQDFKAHRSTTVKLGRFTMLVGGNASGKTSVLDALWLQAAMDQAAMGVLTGNWLPEDLLRRGADGPVVLTSKGRDWKTKVKLARLPDRGAFLEEPWELRFEGVDEKSSIDARALRQSDGDVSTPTGWNEIKRFVGSAGLYRLRADNVAAAAYSDNPHAPVESDGTNTAVALAAMKLGNDEAFDRVEAAMRKLIPAVERIRLRPAKVVRSAPTGGSVLGSKLYFDFRGAPGVPAQNASHGTLIVLALLTVLHGSRRPDLILLDDFDHALHPRAQMELVRMIKGLLELDEFRGVQIVATTHSPYVLDELDPSEVQVFALRDDGTVASKRLSEHPEAAKTKGMLRAGQLWSLDPERDWVLREPTT